jgi:hypothetical protein
MAESTGASNREHLTPLEEQYIKEVEEEGDADEILSFEKDLAAQKLWQSFQESALALANLFRDCQQRTGLSGWVPFHDSASAVTQLYRGSADVCRQCIDCGARYGYRRRTKDVLSWAEKKKRFIKREELIAFLLDKPEQTSDLSSRMEDEIVSNPCCLSVQAPSPRRRMICREDFSMTDQSSEQPVLFKDCSRKRQNSVDLGSNITSYSEFGPITKRIKF